MSRGTARTKAAARLLLLGAACAACSSTGGSGASAKAVRGAPDASPSASASGVDASLAADAAGSAESGNATAPVENAIDRINFGDRGSDATGESAHGLDLAAPTDGTGSFGQTYRVIGASSTAPGDPSQNVVLAFDMACDASVQTYLTVKLWGGDTTVGIVYLYDSSRGYQQSNYNGQSIPEIDIQEDATPMAPGRFVYVTMPIPIAWTQGRASVHLTLNAAESFSYYGGRTTTQLGAGQTSRPVYSAFTHTAPMLNLLGDDLRTTQTAASAPTPLVFNASYVASLQLRYSNRIDSYREATVGGGQWVQAWGPAWDAAVTAGAVPAQVVGLFLGNVTPGSSKTPSAWLDYAATTMSAGNDNPMLRLDDLGTAFAQNLAPAYYRNAEIRQRVIAGIDAAFYLQSLNGAFGGLTSWVGLGATTATTANPQGRLAAAGNPIEGNGTVALGSALMNLSGDATFLTALGANINPTLVPGTTRYQAWGQMFSRHVTFLLGRHGTAPNQDILQARALIASNEAAKFIDARYGTTFASADATIVAYVHQACGVTASSQGPKWFSPEGLSLEVHGVGNGGFDGGYGLNGMLLVVEVAKMLLDAGLETDSTHPVRDVALAAVHAFGNFIEPSVTPADVATLRREEVITFRKNFDVGEIDVGASYIAAYAFGDPYAIHAFHLERLFGLSPPAWNDPNVDEGQNRMFRWGSAYVGLVQSAIVAANGGPVTDPSGVTLLHESGHADGAWVDPVAGALTFQQDGQHAFVALNWRPYGFGDASAYVQPGAAGTLSNVARLHIVTASADRVVTVLLPTSAATGASAGFTSGGYGTQYLLRYGPYAAALNLANTSTSLTFPPASNANWATDWVSATPYDLTTSPAIPLLAASGACFTLGPTQPASQSASALAY